MRRSICILAGAVPLCLAGGAWAQSTPDGAAGLRDGLNEMLKPILDIRVQQQPLFTGPVTVEPAGAGYTVVFPGIDLTLKGKEAASKAVALHCDAQTYSAASTGAATWRLESTEPLNCVATPEGESKITLASRSLQAHFTVDLQQKLFTEGEWRIDGLSGTQDGKQGKVTVDTLSASSRLRPATAPDRHDVAFKMEASGISALDETGVERFSMGHAAYDGTMDGMNVHQVMSSYGQVIDVYVEMFESLADSGTAADPKQAAAVQGEVMKRIMGPFKEMMAAYGDGGQFGATMTDLRVKAPDVQVTLDRTRIVEGYAGAATPGSGTGVIEMEMAGLAIAPKPPFAEWIPTDATIRLNASAVPWAEVGTAYMGVMEASAGQAADPAKAQQAMAQAMMELGGVLRKAGSRLDITSFHIAAPEAAIDLKGSVQGKEAAKHGVNADLDLRFTNLDGLIKFIQSQPDGAQAAAGLTMAQVMGRQATAEDGRPARDYDIVVDDAGKILVNGTDLAALAPKQ
ncbi:hypothetical protein [Inquilinus limosus]|uniref:DUF945 domain-containing protein n=1 Tax=Inquilinus limosus MP06 TaxID=1398085 RepID=A0A0A0D253_9PROT|nr:hypothetical protein [Inquilinus limosus]KGM31948.1 hypothetical protein P409_24245 [Inquilinus limosus MP06]